MGEGSILRVIRRYRRRRCCTCRRMYALARSLSPAGSLVYSLLPCCRAHAHPHSHFPFYSPLPCCCYHCIVVAVAVVAAATAVHTLSSFSLVLARAVAAAAVIAAAACALTGPHLFAFMLVFSSVCGTTSACKTKISFKDCI